LEIIWDGIFIITNKSFFIPLTGNLILLPFIKSHPQNPHSGVEGYKSNAYGLNQQFLTKGYPKTAFIISYLLTNRAPIVAIFPGVFV